MENKANYIQTIQVYYKSIQVVFNLGGWSDLTKIRD